MLGPAAAVVVVVQAAVDLVPEVEVAVEKGATKMGSYPTDPFPRHTTIILCVRVPMVRRW